MAKEGTGGGGAASGIVLAFTFDATDTLEVERDTSSGFGTATQVAALTGGDQEWTDPLPITTTQYYYRARPVRGFQVGAWVNYGAPTGITPDEILA